MTNLDARQIEGLYTTLTRSVAAGFNHHFVKPIDPDALDNLIVHRDATGAEVGARKPRGLR